MTVCLVCGGVVEGVVGLCGSCGAPAGGGGRGVLLAGCVVGRYRVERVLGQGGFGVTYLATDVLLGRRVALKELFPDGCVRVGLTVSGGQTFGEVRRLFVREAQAMASLPHHSGLAQVHELLEENGTAYLAMEFVDGVSAAALVAGSSGGLDEGRVLGWVFQLASALGVVHGAGLLHRDVKPENIMVGSSVGGGERAVLVDFGSAREFLAGTSSMTSLVTPGYAPIEQYGRSQRFGPALDVYALGSTMYHLLSGIAPVSAPDRVGSDPVVPLRSLVPHVTQRTSDAVSRAMAMSATDRHPDTTTFTTTLTPPPPKVSVPTTPLATPTIGPTSAIPATPSTGSTQFAPSTTVTVSKRSLTVAAGAGLTACVAVAAAWLLLSGSGKSDQAAPRPKPAASVPTSVAAPADTTKPTAPAASSVATSVAWSVPETGPYVYWWNTRFWVLNSSGTLSCWQSDLTTEGCVSGVSPPSVIAGSDGLRVAGGTGPVFPLVGAPKRLLLSASDRVSYVDADGDVWVADRLWGGDWTKSKIVGLLGREVVSLPLVSPNGRFLALVDSFGTVRVYSRNSGTDSWLRVPGNFGSSALAAGWAGPTFNDGPQSVVFLSGGKLDSLEVDRGRAPVATTTVPTQAQVAVVKPQVTPKPAARPKPKTPVVSSSENAKSAPIEEPPSDTETASTSAQLGVPGAPGTPGGSGISTSQIQLSWGGPGDVGNPAFKRYVVRINGGQTVDVGGATSYTWGSLGAGTAYIFDVQACSTFGCGPFSGMVAIGTQNPPRPPPSVTPSTASSAA